MKHSDSPEDWRAGGFGLYLHWPFCAAKCPYCDFNSHVQAKVDQRRWAEAYCREIARVGAETEGRVLRSLFLGGGTPSLMYPETVAAILEAVRGTWTLANDVEITLEANPGSVEAERFRGYAAAGVNRISMGFQSLDDAALRQLGRVHTVDESLRALEIAGSTFARVSFDLIYARQGQTLESWRAELERALSFGTEHLSLYQLTIEEGTPFARRHEAGLLRGLPDEDLAAEMYEMTQEMCERAGLPAYEVSNHARPGAESRHNMIYWTGGDYAGIGPGAHGRLTMAGARVATECPRQPGAWLEAAERGNGEGRRVVLSPHEQATEYLIMGLRSEAGLDLGRLRRLVGDRVPQEAVDELAGLGLIEQRGDLLVATRAGRLLLDAVIRRLSDCLTPDSQA